MIRTGDGDHPPKPLGLHHVALQVVDLEACERFYVDFLGMAVEWRPDPDSVYLTGGADNLALHRANAPPAPHASQRLGHIGLILARIEDVDLWYRHALGKGVPIVAMPRTHRDGARSFYCRDPAGNTLQIIFHPPLAPS